MKPVLDIIDGASARAGFACGGFSGLIAPLTEQRFLEHYWERAPFLIKRGQAGHFDTLLALPEIDALIGGRLFRENDIRIAKAGVLKPFSAFALGEAADRRVILDEYERGATIVFEHLNRHHAVLGRLLAECERELQMPIRANAYLTPARSQGFSLHYDTHDVLVLQVSGSKTWQIYNSPLALPDEEQSFSSAWLGEAVQIAEVSLEPGDVLYLPRGFIHGASANQDTSLHITVGMRAMTLRDVAVAVVKQAAMGDPVLRRAARFQGPQRAQALAATRAHLHQMVDELGLAARFDDVLYSFIKKRTLPLNGCLLDQVLDAGIGLDTSLRVRAGMLLHPFTSEGMVRLVVNGSKVLLPAGAGETLHQMLSMQPFSARSLPGLDADSRLALLHQLHRAGALVIAAPDTNQLTKPANGPVPHIQQGAIA